jgi:hypothetical protein
MKHIIFSLLLFLLPNLAFSQINSPPSLILAEIMMSDQEIDLKQYNSFWQKIGATTPQERKPIIQQAKRIFLAIILINQKIWQCAEESFLSSVASACPDGKAIISQLRQGFANNTQIQASEIQTINNLEQKMSQIMQASANKTSITSANGKPKPITLAEIKTAKNTAEKVLIRAEKLLTENFEN